MINSDEIIFNGSKNKEGDDQLKDITIKLASITDVQGAVLFKKSGSVITWHTNENGNKVKIKACIDHINAYTSTPSLNDVYYHKDGMFKESIIDYNGFKLLTTKVIDDIFVVLIIDKKSYLGLTMLDVESYLQNLESALEGKRN